MNLKSFKPITETKYLSVENAWRYRAIMRIFYQFDMRFKHWLSKEDIYAEVMKLEAFAEYTLELCRQDLDALCQWGNLSAVQDASKVATYQQFVNKQYRYQMTEYAIEIERMTVRLENLFIEGGSLEPTLLERIKEELLKIKDMVQADSKTAGGWWNQLSSDFQRLNQNYQDYIRDWNSAKAEELMKTASFIMYKEKLVDYLRSFIKGLQVHAYEIETILKTVNKEEIKILWNGIADYEMDIPRIDMESIKREDVYNNIAGKYESLETFFIGSSSRESEVETILTMTNEIIRRITRYAANILELSSQFSNRKDEYLQVAKLFLGAETVDEAHKMSACLFGIKGYKHYGGELTRETESIQSSIFDEAPMAVVLSPRIRNYREKLKKTAIVDRTEEKNRMREQVIKEKEEEKTLLLSYLETGHVEFKHLNGLPPKVRRTLLRWLAKGIREKGRMTVTEHGQKYCLENPQEEQLCTIECEDGSLVMPAYVLRFEV